MKRVVGLLLVIIAVPMARARAQQVAYAANVMTELDSATEVALTHERDVDEKQRSGHQEGWKICFDRIEKWIEETRRKS